MSAADAGAPPRAYGTRWRRTAVVAGTGLLGMGGLIGLMKAQIIATAITVQSGTADFSTTRVHGDVVAMGMVSVPRYTATGVTPTDVLRAGFAGANINGFCLSQKQSLGGLSYTVKVLGGDGQASTFETTGKNIVLDIVSMRGTSNPGINLDGLVELGVRSDSLHTIPDPANPANFLDNPLGAPTTDGWYGIQASIGQLYNLRGKVYDMQIGGPLNMPGLKITVVKDGKTCAEDTAIPN